MEYLVFQGDIQNVHLYIDEMGMEDGLWCLTL